MAEKRTIELEIQDNSKTLKQQYKEAVKELQNMASAFGEMSDEAVNAAKRAAELKDQIEDTNDLMKSFKGEGAFVAMGKAMSSVASGFSAIEGGLALVGVESEKVQETMLRVQAAMALAQGLEGLEDAGRAFTLLGKKATTALKGIKTELIATGIGAFVVALGTVVAYWDEISEAVSGVSSEQKSLNKLTAKNQEISNKTLEDYENQNFVLKLQGKSDKQILEGKIKLQERIVKDNIDNLKNIENTAKAELRFSKMKEKGLLLQYELYKYLISIALDFAAKPIDLFIDKVNSIADAIGLGKLITFNTEDVKKTALGAITTVENTFKSIFTSVGILADETELNKQIKEADSLLKKSQNELAQSKLELRDMDVKTSKESVNTQKDNEKEKLDLTRQRIDNEIELMQEGESKEKRILEEKAKREKEDLAKSIEGKIYDQEEYAKTQKLIDDNLKKDLQSITDKYDKIEKDARDLKLQEQIKAEDEQWYALQKIKNSQKEQELLDLQIAYDKEYEAAANNAELQKELTRKFNKDSAAINEKYRKEEAAKEIEAAKAVREQKQAIQNQGIELALEGVQLIKNVFEKSKGVQKAAVIAESAIGIAKMIISNKLANAGALATPQAIATSGAAAAPVIAMNNISTGIGIAANIAATAKALKSLGGGSAPNAPAGSGGGGGVAAPMTANFNTIGSSGINQLAQLQQTPTQAYVVSGEVTSAQALDRNRVQNATL